MTIEKLGWIIIVVGLMVAVAAIIITPILDKAKESKDDIGKIKFTASSNYNIQRGQTELKDGSKIIWAA